MMATVCVRERDERTAVNHVIHRRRWNIRRSALHQERTCELWASKLHLTHEIDLARENIVI